MALGFAVAASSFSTIILTSVSSFCLLLLQNVCSQLSSGMIEKIRIEKQEAEKQRGLHKTLSRFRSARLSCCPAQFSLAVRKLLSISF